MRLGLLWLLLFLPFAAGCASYSAQGLPEVAAGNLPNKARWAELTVGAALPGKPEEVTLRFGRDLLAYDILPVLLYLQNQSQDVAYTINSADIEFQLRDGETLRPQSPDQVYDDAAFSHWRAFWGWIPFIIPGPFCHMSIAGANNDMYQDYFAKAFVDVSLPERNSTTIRRVVFFRAPSEKSLEETNYQDGTLLVRASRMQVTGDSGNAEPDKLLEIIFRK